MSNLNRHVKNDKVKWIITSIAFVLVFVLVAGLCMQLFAADKFKPSNWFTKAECEHVYGADGKCEKCGKDKPVIHNALFQQSIGNGVSLTAVPLSTDDSYEVTATVRPLSGEYTINWSAAWANPESEWANGKETEDYIVVVPSDSTLTSTVKIKQAFGEQILLDASVSSYLTIFATLPIDYEECFTDVNYSLSWGNEAYEFKNGTVIPFDNMVPGKGSVNIVKSVGSISKNYTATASMTFTEEYTNYLKNNGFEKILVKPCSSVNAVGDIDVQSIFDCFLNSMMSDEILLQGKELEYYKDLYDLTRSYDGDIFAVAITVKENNVTIAEKTVTATLEKDRMVYSG